MFAALWGKKRTSSSTLRVTTSKSDAALEKLEDETRALETLMKAQSEAIEAKNLKQEKEQQQFEEQQRLRLEAKNNEIKERNATRKRKRENLVNVGSSKTPAPIHDVNAAMSQNKVKAQERGEQLAELVDNTANMDANAKNFLNSARKLGQQQRGAQPEKQNVLKDENKEKGKEKEQSSTSSATDNSQKAAPEKKGFLGGIFSRNQKKDLTQRALSSTGNPSSPGKVYDLETYAFISEKVAKIQSLEEQLQKFQTKMVKCEQAPQRKETIKISLQKLNNVKAEITRHFKAGELTEPTLKEEANKLFEEAIRQLFAEENKTRFSHKSQGFFSKYVTTSRTAKEYNRALKDVLKEDYSTFENSKGIQLT